MVGGCGGVVGLGLEGDGGSVLMGVLGLAVVGNLGLVAVVMVSDVVHLQERRRWLGNWCTCIECS